MTRVYASLALLVLYGDLMKRLLPASVAQGTLYASAALILLLVAVQKGPRLVPRMSHEGRAAHIAAVLLVLLYALQMVTSLHGDLSLALSHAAYMIIPLAYICVIQKSAQFELGKLAHWFLILMLPVNAVGIYQHYADPGFLISTIYAGDEGGVILRNFLDEGFFARYPSIFVSADRYSAMAVFQFYFALYLAQHFAAFHARYRLWLLFNFVSSIAALLIAGARSRILIALCGVLAIMLVYLFKLIFSGRLSTRRRMTHLLSLAFALAAVAGPLIASYQYFDWSPLERFPVLSLLGQSVEQKDFSIRVNEAITLSLVHDEITLFGQGLGSVGGGKPGEFGIMSIWVESGLFWGSLMLIAYSAMAYALFAATAKSVLRLQPTAVGLHFIPLLLLLFGLLAGLTSTFELSSGILLGCAIASNLRGSWIAAAVQARPAPRFGEVY